MQHPLVTRQNLTEASSLFLGQSVTVLTNDRGELCVHFGLLIRRKRIRVTAILRGADSRTRNARYRQESCTKSGFPA